MYIIVIHSYVNIVIYRYVCVCIYIYIYVYRYVTATRRGQDKQGRHRSAAIPGNILLRIMSLIVLV